MTPTTLGMETSVRNQLFVQEEEFGTEIIKSVSVPTVKLGMEPHALFENHVVVERIGMIQVYNAIVQLASIGMAELVFTVLTVKSLIPQLDHVSVNLALNGTINFALWFKDVKVEQFGIRTLGHANVLLLLSGIICIVWPIHALEVKFGTTSPKLVFV